MSPLTTPNKVLAIALSAATLTPPIPNADAKEPARVRAGETVSKANSSLPATSTLKLSTIARSEGFIDQGNGYFRNEAILLWGSNGKVGIGVALPGSLELGWSPQESYDTIRDGKYYEAARVATGISIERVSDGKSSSDRISLNTSYLEKEINGNSTAQISLNEPTGLHVGKSPKISSTPFLEQLAQLGFKRINDCIYSRSVLTAVGPKDLICIIDQKSAGCIGLFFKTDLQLASSEGVHIAESSYLPNDAVWVLFNRGGKSFAIGDDGRLISQKQIYTGSTVSGEKISFHGFEKEVGYEYTQYSLKIDGLDVAVKQVNFVGNDSSRITGVTAEDGRRVLFDTEDGKPIVEKVIN